MVTNADAFPPASPKGNLTLWNSVAETDPANTKQVSLGRKFTAIDAHSQIKRATEVWGPMGEGWGHDIRHVQQIGDTVVVQIEFWHGSRSNSFGGVGQCKLASKAGAVDEDAAKKAETDAITKALSRLGFNADVFEGKFDSKHVSEKPQEPLDGNFQQVGAAAPTMTTTASSPSYEALLEMIKAAANTAILDSLARDNKAFIAHLEDEDKETLKWAGETKRKELKENQNYGL